MLRKAPRQSNLQQQAMRMRKIKQRPSFLTWMVCSATVRSFLEGAYFFNISQVFSDLESAVLSSPRSISQLIKELLFKGGPNCICKIQTSSRKFLAKVCDVIMLLGSSALCHITLYCMQHGCDCPRRAVWRQGKS